MELLPTPMTTQVSLLMVTTTSEAVDKVSLTHDSTMPATPPLIQTLRLTTPTPNMEATVAQLSSTPTTASAPSQLCLQTLLMTITTTKSSTWRPKKSPTITEPTLSLMFNLKFPSWLTSRKNSLISRTTRLRLNTQLMSKFQELRPTKKTKKFLTSDTRCKLTMPPSVFLSSNHTPNSLMLTTPKLSPKP